MIISYVHKFIFFECGKTGTTSIVHTLEKYDEGEILRQEIDKDLDKMRHSEGKPYNIRHIRPMSVKEKLTEAAWNDYFKFTFVRNPWDWVISQYFFNNRKKSRRMKYFEKEHFFEIWEQLKKHNQSPGTENYFQHTFVIDSQRKPLVNFVGKFENLQEDFNKVCDRVNINRIKLPHLNKTRHKSYREYYTKETKQLVTEKYKRDIELLGYEF